MSESQELFCLVNRTMQSSKNNWFTIGSLSYDQFIEKLPGLGNDACMYVCRPIVYICLSDLHVGLPY